MKSVAGRALGVAAVATVVWAWSPVAMGQEKAAAPAATAPVETPEVAKDPLEGGSVEFDKDVAAKLEVKRAPTGHLLVRPRVNGHDAGWFIFDTGAGVCVISTPFVEKLGLERTGDIDAVGVGGASKAAMYRAAAVVLGPMTLKDHPVMTADLSFLKQHLKDEIVGVIGYGVLSRSVAELDLAGGTISLYDPAAYTLSKGEWAPLDVANRTATVHAKFDGGEGDFGLDTGANGYVTFHEPTTRKLKLLEGRETRDMKLGGVGGFVAGKEAELAWFELGGVRLEKVKASFAVEAKGTFANESKSGNIGTQMLKPFTLIFDYTNGRMAFVKREEASAGPELSPAGAAVSK